MENIIKNNKGDICYYRQIEESYNDRYNPLNDESTIKIIALDSNDYKLGHEQYANNNAESFDEWVIWTLIDYCNLNTILNVNDNSFDDNTSEEEYQEVLYQAAKLWAEENIQWLPIKAYEHGCMELSTQISNKYSCQWDSSYIGIIFERIDQTPSSTKEEINTRLDEFVKDYNAYINNDIYDLYTICNTEKNISDIDEKYMLKNHQQHDLIYGYNNINKKINNI